MHPTHKCFHAKARPCEEPSPSWLTKDQFIYSSMGFSAVKYLLLSDAVHVPPIRAHTLKHEQLNMPTQVKGTLHYDFSLLSIYPGCAITTDKNFTTFHSKNNRTDF